MPIIDFRSDAEKVAAGDMPEEEVQPEIKFEPHEFRVPQQQGPPPNPYKMFTDPEYRKKPVHERFIRFWEVSKNDERWANATPEQKAKYFKQLFDVEKPTDMLKSEEFKNYDPRTQEALYHAVMDNDERYAALPIEKKKLFRAKLLPHMREGYEMGQEQQQFREGQMQTHSQEVLSQYPDADPKKVDQFATFRTELDELVSSRDFQANEDGYVGRTEMLTKFKEKWEKEGYFPMGKEEWIKARKTALYSSPAQRYGYEGEEPDGVAENIANASARGWNQFKLAKTMMFELRILDEMYGNNPDITPEQRKAALDKVAALQREIESIPQSISSKHVADGTYSDAEFLGWLAQVTTESMVASVPATAVGSAVGGGAGTAIAPGVGTLIGSALGAGAASGMLEYGPSVLDAWREAGVDTNDPEAMLQAMTDPEMRKRARSHAAKRTIPVVAFDVLTAGVAGKLAGAKKAVQAATGGTKGWAARAGKAAISLGVEASGGATGEALAGLWADGEIDWKSVIAEAVGEMATTPGDVAPVIAEAYISGTGEAITPDLSGIGNEFGPAPSEPPAGGVPGDTGPRVPQFDPAKPTYETTDEGEPPIWPENLPEAAAADLGTIDPKDQQTIFDTAQDLWNQRVRAKAATYDLDPDSPADMIQFPMQEAEDMGAQAILDTLAAYRQENPAAETKKKDETTEPEGGADDEDTAPVAEEKPPITGIPVNKWKERVRNAANAEELDKIEEEFLRSDKTFSNPTKTLIEKQRAAFAKEAETDLGEDDFAGGPTTLIENVKPGDQVRFVDEETGEEIVGRIIEGDEEGVFGIDDGNKIAYYPEGTEVELPPQKQKVEMPADEAPVYDEMTMQDWVNDYSTVHGYIPANNLDEAVEELTQYMSDNGYDADPDEVREGLKNDPHHGFSPIGWMEAFRTENPEKRMSPIQMADFINEKAGLKGKKKVSANDAEHIMDIAKWGEPERASAVEKSRKTKAAKKKAKPKETKEKEDGLREEEEATVEEEEGELGLSPDQDAVYQAVQEGLLSAAQIADKTGFSPQKVRKLARGLRDQGLVAIGQKPVRGVKANVYTIPGREEVAVEEEVAETPPPKKKAKPKKKKTKKPGPKKGTKKAEAKPVVPVGQRKEAARQATTMEELDAIEEAVNQEVESGARKTFPGALKTLLGMQRDDIANKPKKKAAPKKKAPPKKKVEPKKKPEPKKKAPAEVAEEAGLPKIEVRRTKSGAPNLRDLKQKISSATTIEEVGEAGQIEAQAVADGVLKAPRKQIVAAIEQQLKKLGVDTEQKAAPKKTVESAEPEAKTARDLVYDDRLEGFGTTAEDVDAAYDALKITRTKNGAASVKEMKDAIRNATSLAEVMAVERMYREDVESGVRNKQSALEKLLDTNEARVLAGEKPKPKPKKKAAPKKKETVKDLAAELEKTIEEPWPIEAEDGEFAYLDTLGDERKVEAAVEEIEGLWFKLNGITDHMDMNFAEQAIDVLMGDAPSLADHIQEITEALDPVLDTEHKVRVFLNYEYPGALTLKQAQGASPTFSRGAAIGPATGGTGSKTAGKGGQTAAPRQKVQRAAQALSPISAFRFQVEQAPKAFENIGEDVDADVDVKERVVITKDSGERPAIDKDLKKLSPKELMEEADKLLEEAKKEAKEKEKTDAEKNEEEMDGLFEKLEAALKEEGVDIDNLPEPDAEDVTVFPDPRSGDDNVKFRQNIFDLKASDTPNDARSGAFEIAYDEDMEAATKFLQELLAQKDEKGSMIKYMTEMAHNAGIHIAFEFSFSEDPRYGGIQIWADYTLTANNTKIKPKTHARDINRPTEKTKPGGALPIELRKKATDAIPKTQVERFTKDAGKPVFVGALFDVDGDLWVNFFDEDGNDMGDISYSPQSRPYEGIRDVYNEMTGENVAQFGEFGRPVGKRSITLTPPQIPLMSFQVQETLSIEHPADADFGDVGKKYIGAVTRNGDGTYDNDGTFPGDLTGTYNLNVFSEDGRDLYDLKIGVDHPAYRSVDGLFAAFAGETQSPKPGRGFIVEEKAKKETTPRLDDTEDGIVNSLFEERYPQERESGEGERLRNQRPVDTKAVERYLPGTGWKVTKTANGWTISGKNGRVKLEIVRKSHRAMTLAHLHRQPGEAQKLLEKYGSSQAVLAAIDAGDVVAAGGYTFDSVTGVHLISLNDKYGGTETFFHEMFHFALRNFLEDGEINIILENFENEEYAARWYAKEMMENDELARIDDGDYQEPSKDAGAVRKIFEYIKEMGQKLASVMGINPKTNEATHAILSTATILNQILSTEKFSSPLLGNWQASGLATLGEIKAQGYPRGPVMAAKGWSIPAKKMYEGLTRLINAEYTQEQVAETGITVDGLPPGYVVVPITDRVRNMINRVRRQDRTEGATTPGEFYAGLGDPQYMVYRLGNEGVGMEWLMRLDEQSGEWDLTNYAATPEEAVTAWQEATDNDWNEVTDFGEPTIEDRIAAHVGQLHMSDVINRGVNNNENDTKRMLEQSLGINQPNDVPSETPPMESEADVKPRGFSLITTNLKAATKMALKVAHLDNKKVGQNLRLHRGLPKDLYVAFIQRKRGAQAGKYYGAAARKDIQNIVKGLKDKHGKERVSNALSMVLDGRMPLDQFKSIYDLKDGNKMLDSLNKLIADKIKMQEKLASMPNIPQQLKEIILNNDFYQTRIYAIHVLGDGYAPNTEAYQNAVQAMYDYYGAYLDDRLAKATTIIGKKEPFDFPAYLYSDTKGREAMLEGLPKTKKRSIISLANSIDPWLSAYESMELVEGNIVSVQSVDSLMAIAEDVVDGYLESAAARKKVRPVGPLGGTPLANFTERRLDEIFRDLYGEITDPGERLARTLEVQHDLVAASVFFQKMFEEGENKWWSRTRSAKFSRPLVSEGKRVSNVKRYGNMAGKFVSEQTYDLLHGEGTFKTVMDTNAWGRGFQKYQSVVRGTRLLWVKTALRNAFTATTGFALRSGDALRLNHGWLKHFAEGWKIAAAAAAGTAEGNRKLAELVGQDIFDVTQDSMLAAIRANLESGAFTVGKSKLGGTLNEAMKWYALIDLPAKYAAYKVSRSRGMTHEDAVAHVREFYQYRDFVPEAVTKINRWPMGDYFGYTVDSSRIWVNTTKHVVTSIKDGDPIPLFGYILSTTVPAFRYGTGGWLAALAPKFFTMAAGNLLNALGITDEDDDENIRVATDEQVTAHRKTLARYDSDMPIAMWYEKNKETGLWDIRYNVMSNTSAFPIEDVFIGAIQTAAQAPEGSGLSTFGGALIHNLNEAAPWHPGMAIENLVKLTLGIDMATGQKRPSMLDLYHSWQTEDEEMRPDWPEVFTERGGEFVGESFAPGQSYNMARAALEVASGKEPRIGRHIRRKTKEDVYDLATRLVRKYRVEGEDQMNLLRNMTRQSFENLGISKYLAGSADRAEIKYRSGVFRTEMLKTDRGKAAWRRSLKSLEAKVGDFKTIVGDNFTDDQIVEALAGFGTIRISEAEAIVKGTVDQMEAKAFESGEDPYATEPRPLRTQKGQAFANEYFRNNPGRVSYRDLHKQMSEKGYIVGPYDKKFKDRMVGWRRSLRRDE